MKPWRFLLFVAALFACAISVAEEEEAYFGEWSSGHGEVIRISAGKLQLNGDPPISYDDITEDSDGSFFVLQLTASTEPGSFSGRFLRLTFGTDPDHFTMTTYKTLADALHQQNGTGRREWTAVDD